MGRFRRGHTKSAKVTAVDVVQMREEYNQGATQGDLARKYQLSVVQIGRIVRGESWIRIAAPNYQEAMDESAALIDSAVPMPIDLPPDFLAELAAAQHIAAAPAMPISPEAAARAAAYGAKSKPAIQAQPVQDAQRGAMDGSAAPERGVSDDPFDQSTEESAK